MIEPEKAVADAWQSLHTAGGPSVNYEQYGNVDMIRGQLMAQNRSRAQVRAVVDENKQLRDLLADAAKTIDALAEENEALKKTRKK